MKDIGYSGQYLDNKEFRLKFRTGGDILNATGDAVAGEILVQTGVSPAVYIATETSTLDTSSIFKIADLTKKVGAAGNFDGTNDHAITSGSPVDMGDMASGYTFSGWVWREDVASLPSNGGTTNWLSGAYGTADGAPNFNTFKWYITDEYWNGNVYNIIRWYHGSQAISNSSTLLPAGAWSHLAVTWDGSSTVKTYLNGSQLAQITNASSLTARADKMLVGKGHFYHKGLVDEVAYWNRGLSAAQITNIYRGESDGGSGGSNGTPGDLSSFSPIGWWRMGDNDTGSTVTDQGSGGNDLTMKNGASFSSSTP